MGLSGTFSTMPLADLLQWLAGGKLSGTLVVRGDRFTKKIYLKSGRIISSSSDDPTEQLGHFLLSHGRITEEQLKKGLDTQARTPVLLGKILVMIGAVEEEELRRLLGTKAEETIFSLFLWADAHFEFMHDELPKELFIPIALDVQDALLNGLTRVDELRHIREEFGSPRSVLRRSKAQLPAGFDKDSSLVGKVLGAVDGQRSIADLCLTLHASEFLVSKLLYQFFRKGFVAIAKRVEEAQTAAIHGGGSSQTAMAESLVARGREAFARADHAASVEFLQQAIAFAPQDLAIKKLYDKACAIFKEHVYRDQLQPQRIPNLARQMNELTSEKLTPEEVFLISRINGSWDIRSIIDICPIGEIEALRLMKKLVERGIISLS